MRLFYFWKLFEFNWRAGINSTLTNIQIPSRGNSAVSAYITIARTAIHAFRWEAIVLQVHTALLLAHNTQRKVYKQ